MTNQILKSLIIESKQGAYDMVYNLIKGYASAFGEAQNEPGEDEESKAILKGKEGLCRELLDAISNEYERHIDEVNHRYPCDESLNTSTGYPAYLPNGWTRS